MGLLFRYGREKSDEATMEDHLGRFLAAMSDQETK
jgi:hypothetical protein